jgi:hypothetical protein
MPQTVSSPSPTSTKPGLVLSTFNPRLEALEKEHQWLIKQIKRKKTELKNFTEQTRLLFRELYSQGSAYTEKILALDKKIHQLFQEMLTSDRFDKKAKKNIRLVYTSLQKSGIITRNFDEDEILKKLTKDDNEEEEDFSKQSQNQSQGQQNQQYNRHGEHESPSAVKAENSKDVRQIYLKLAEVFHPDKATDESKKSHYTEIMKEINIAYQEGDMARLLEIEEKYQEESISENNPQYLERKFLRLEQENKFLKQQYEGLKEELRSFKKTEQGKMYSEYKKAGSKGFDTKAKYLKEFDYHLKALKQVCTFVDNFKDHRISILEFLKGPVIVINDMNDFLDDLSDDDLEYPPF